MDLQPTVAQVSRETACHPQAESSVMDWAAKASDGVRRAVDFLAALMGLALSLPIMLVLAILVRMDSPGPALFWQVRVGRNRRRHRQEGSTYHGPERRGRNYGGKPFWFVKFRTMYVDARERFPELYKYQYRRDDLPNLRFKQEDDPRHTPLGRWLRKTSLDELPNFWNVLAGSMTLVGPRPDIPEMVQYYRPEQMRIFDVKPGLTGYAQVSGRCSLKFVETKSLDLQYVRERSLRSDVKVLVQTFTSVLTAKGAF